MGKGYKIKCDNCLYEREVLEGKGKDYHSLEKLVKNFKLPSGKIIIKILKKHHLLLKNRTRKPLYEDNPFFEERIYRCRNCGRFDSQLYIRIRTPQKWIFNDQSKKKGNQRPGEIIFRSKNRCKICGIRLRHVKSNNLINLPCPDCKIIGLTTEFFLWE